MAQLEAAVIGGGVMGCAAAYHLARRLAERGAPRGSVALFEQFSIGHDRGSSHGPSRIIRLTYDHPAYVRLARAAYGEWEALERDSGEALLLRTGDLFFGPSSGPIAKYAESLEAVGVPFDRLSPAQAARRFPAFRLPRGYAALHQAESGILPADRCVRALARMARKHGARILARTPVRTIEPEGGSLLLRAGRKVWRARRVVVAAGPWIARLVPDLASRLRVTRQEVCYFRPRGDAAPYRPDRLPVWVYLGAEKPDPTLYYGIPIFGRFGVKAARHGTRAAEVDPDRVSRRVSAAGIAELRGFLGRHLPGLADAFAVDPHVCLYTVTPDESFILDRHPQDARVVVVSACSGHGFKFAAVVGKIAAELALDGGSSVEAYERDRAIFSLARFRA